jgi:hypothetical protein
MGTCRTLLSPGRSHRPDGPQPAACSLSDTETDQILDLNAWDLMRTVTARPS